MVQAQPPDGRSLCILTVIDEHSRPCLTLEVARRFGAWVLRRACADAAAWPSDTRLAVNLSAVQFRADDLVAEVGHALAGSGLPPKRLVLEVTEAVLLKDARRNLAILDDLHRMGVSTALDDFGTGYSPLSHMWRFPFDSNKIDRAIVRNLSGEDRDTAVMRTIVPLGHALGMAVLAEGVETDEERVILTAEGCDELQGYLFGRPEPLRPAFSSQAA